MIRVVIADSEPLALAHIARLLAARRGIVVVGRLGNAREACEAVRGLVPEIVFLDLELPDLSQFDARAFHEAQRPSALILTTAQARGAPRILHLYALDHLLKPFDEERFEKVLARALAYLGRDGETSLRSQHLRLLSAFPEPGQSRGPRCGVSVVPQRYLDRLLVREGDRIFFLKVEDVDRIEDAAGRSRVHARGRSHLVAESLDDLADRLDPRQFLSIRRSMIVNLDRLEAMERPRLASSS